MENNTAAPERAENVDVRDAGLHLLAATGYGMIVAGVAALHGHGIGIALLGIGLALITLSVTRYAKKRGEALATQGRSGGARVASIAYAVTAVTGSLLALGLFLAHADATLGWGLAILLVPALFGIGAIYEHTLTHQED